MNYIIHCKRLSKRNFPFENGNHLGNINGCFGFRRKPNYNHDSRHERSESSGVCVVINDNADVAAQVSTCPDAASQVRTGKTPTCVTGNPVTWTAEVMEANDYYPFGQVMPGRTYQLGSKKFRWGMGGQEKDDDVATGLYTAEFWEYDSRIARRWNSDPIEYAWQSPYACFNNNPIYFIDPLGLQGGDPKVGDTRVWSDGNGHTQNQIFASDGQWWPNGTLKEFKLIEKRSWLKNILHHLESGFKKIVNTVGKISQQINNSFKKSNSWLNSKVPSKNLPSYSLVPNVSDQMEYHNSSSSTQINTQWDNTNAIFWKDLNVGVGSFGVGHGVKGELINYAAKISPEINNLKYVKGMKIVGYGTFWLSSAITAGQAINYYSNGGTNSSVLIKSTIDIGMAYVAFLGPIGFAISATYFILDEAGAFNGYGDPLITPK